ncbi:MAG: hypothetical protein MZV65_47730 [Chromatiales bacterium]|nr:hypothetical protein [Chromatiales bacterium]MCK7582522.1 hypothetical protein [Chromatiales bacterium]
MAAVFFFKKEKNHISAVFILLAGLLVAWSLYQPGIEGGYHFDDEPNLHGLGAISSKSEAIDFIFSGLSEPLGRPISLASFAFQAYAWPTNPDIFLRTNILIHIFNGLLVIWIVFRLLEIKKPFDTVSNSNVAAATGSLWMILPVLASSSLFIVQRMAILSGFFYCQEFCFI